MRSLIVVLVGVVFAFSGATRTEAGPMALGGQVLELGTDVPLAHVSVLIGSTLITDDKVPAELPRDVVSTVTDADGRFAFPAVPAGRNFVEVLPTGGYYSLHARFDGHAERVVYRLSRATAEETAWLAQLNADRAVNGVAGRVVVDELVEETARYRARAMAASGIFEHRDAFTHYQDIGGLYPPGESSAAENIGVISTPSSWREVQHLFMAEKGSHGETGHYRAIVDPHAVWVGVAVATRGKPPSLGGLPVDYYAQVFVNRP